MGNIIGGIGCLRSQPNLTIVQHQNKRKSQCKLLVLINILVEHKFQTPGKEIISQRWT